ncbi:MAG: hypothetical protein ACM3JD_07620 [Rudaea sp.]
MTESGIPAAESFRARSADRFLLGIVAAIVLLVALAFALVRLRPQPGYVSEGQPEGVVQNYILAMQQQDLARAYGYLSADLPGYPTSAAVFSDQVYADRWATQVANASTFALQNSRIDGDRAWVTLLEQEAGQGGPLRMGPTYSSSFGIRLKNLNGWKIIHSERYWRSCWESASGCK